MRWIVAVALAAAVLVARPGAADVLCRTRVGRVSLRPSCKKRERRIDLPKGPAGDTGAAAPAPIRVVDAAGLAVGSFADPYNEDDATRIVVAVGGRFVSFVVDRSGVFDGGGDLFHLVANCSDPPLALGRRAPLVREGGVFGSMAYYVDDPVETHTPVAREVRAGSGGCGSSTTLPNGACCVPDGSIVAADYGPVTKAFDVPSLGVTPPLHLEP
jgi:hypothetical protein